MRRRGIHLLRAATLALVAAPPLTAAADDAPPTTSGPAQAKVPSDDYRPLASFHVKGFRIEAPITLAARGEGVSGFPVDRDNTAFQSGFSLSPLLRLSVKLDTVAPLAGKYLIAAEYEHDLPTGTWTSDPLIAGEKLPNSTPIDTQLRKAWARLSIGPYLHIAGGFMTNHWGMGLVADDGAHGWEPGSARFSDPRGGDLVLRGSIATGPLTKARVLAAVGIDKVRSDDVLVEGDSAYQIVASALVGHDRPTQAGVFFAHRRQQAEDGRFLNVNLIDLTGRLTADVNGSTHKLEAEVAIATGDTSLGASADIPESDVLQIGAAIRASVSYERFGIVLDAIYASGDQNTNDAHQNGFKADPNFETGLLLFRYVQAAHTGRGYGRASDPLLVGAPAAGVERLPTRGGISNALVVFPRLWARPLTNLEAYGGWLIALAPQDNLDPFNTNLKGGSIRNALDKVPGPAWGTEFDIGARYRVPIHRTELMIGGEGGLLFPGSAFGDTTPVYGGRLIARYRL